MLHATSKISERTVKAKGHQYRQYFIYLPQDLIKDSQFPFTANDHIAITIDGERLLIEKEKFS